MDIPEKTEHTTENQGQGLILFVCDRRACDQCSRDVSARRTRDMRTTLKWTAAEISSSGRCRRRRCRHTGKKRLITLTAGSAGVWRLLHAGDDRGHAQGAGGEIPLLQHRRQKLNFKAAYKQLQLLLCANFRRRDLYIRLALMTNTFAWPKGSQKVMAKFMDRLRSRRRADGKELRYVYSIHELQDDGSRRPAFPPRDKCH